MRIGSDEHKNLFCRSFIGSHEAYEPADLPWPELDDAALSRLRGIPFWNIALQTEQNAGITLKEFAKTQTDELVREAIALQGDEEARHGRMIGTLVERYHLDAQTEDFTPNPTRRDFIDFGYKECIDSFFGFGAFRLAREARFLPADLISMFTRILVEESRHIVFFVNWVAYDRARRGRGSPMLRAPAVGVGYLRSLLGHFKFAGAAAKKNGEPEKKGAELRLTDEVFGELTLTRFLDACLAENADMMAAFDPRLIRPRLVPAYARLLLGIARPISRLWRGRRRVAAPEASR
jgi:hypothetical protein